ncbi:MAG: ParB/RepB/Spo0J family partition protein [Limnochordia bacterium]|jgi:ParB family chromosome partitioning protein
MSRQVLGKGLRALMPSEGPIPAGEEVREVDIGAIKPNPYQPRRTYDEEALEELAESIGRQGVLQPVLVRKEGDGYTLIVGERRWRAAQRAGLKKMPVIVRQVSDSQMMIQALVENIQREDLNPLEEAEAYRRLMEAGSLTQEQVAEMVGKKRPTVANALRLLSLTAPVQKLLLEGKLSAGHAKVLLALQGEEQMALAQQVVEGGLSVRDTEKLVASRGKKVPRGTKGAPKVRDPQLIDVEDQLQRALGTKVRIKPRGRAAGRIEIEYYSIDDIDRIIEALVGH